MSAELEAVYREYKSAMLAVALNITQCPSLAEDAIQNAFEKMFRSFRSLPANSLGKESMDSDQDVHSLTPRRKNMAQVDTTQSNGENPLTSTAPPINALSRPENLKAYLFQAVRHAAIDIRRRNKRKQPESNISFFENEPLDTQSPDRSAERNEQTTQIQTVINELEESDREIILLKIYSGFTFEKIGEITQTSANTIATRYRRLLVKMKSVLKEQDD